MVFMTPDYSLYALSQINKVNVKYESFGIESNIRIAKPPCSSDYDHYLQNVTLILICQGKKGIGYQYIFEACCFYKTRNLCTFNLQVN